MKNIFRINHTTPLQGVIITVHRKPQAILPDLFEVKISNLSGVLLFPPKSVIISI